MQSRLSFIYLAIFVGLVFGTVPSVFSQPVQSSQTAASSYDPPTFKKQNEKALAALNRMTPGEVETLDKKLAKALTFYYDRKFTHALPFFKEIAGLVETMDIMGGGDQADPGQSDTSDAEASLTEDTEATESAKADGTEDVAQTQTALKVEEEIIAQGESTGYVSAMLTLTEDKGKSFKHLYISNTRQDFLEGSSIEARDTLAGIDGEPLLLVAGGGVELDPTVPGKPKLSSVDVNESGVVDTIRGPFTVTDTVIGNNEFMERGYWTQPDFMTSASGLNYLVDNRGYFVFGRSTTDTEMSDLTVNSTTGTYSGSAQGTYWTETGGTDMAGAFSVDVDFGNKQVNNFGVSVSGGGHAVNISGVNGAFQGNSSQFALDPNTSGSVWQIDGQNAPATKKEA